MSSLSFLLARPILNHRERIWSLGIQLSFRGSNPVPSLAHLACSSFRG